jgi:hypothetical protein
MKRYLVLFYSAIAFCGSIAAFSAAPALAATPPVITSVSSWNVKSSTASLSMTYLNHNQNARVWFEYSTNANLADALKVGEAVHPPIAGGRQAHASIYGLHPNTVYYYRAYARNYDGEVHSGIDQFRTGSAGSSVPAVSFDNARMSGSSLDMDFTCNGNGFAGHCTAEWSPNEYMRSGARELQRMYLAPSRVGSKMYAKFHLSSVPDNTRIYVQATVTTAAGTERTRIRDFVIRNKPI